MDAKLCKLQLKTKVEEQQVRFPYVSRNCSPAVVVHELNKYLNVCVPLNVHARACAHTVSHTHTQTHTHTHRESSSSIE